MKEEKHTEALRETMDEIDASLKDKRGLVAHQRRLALMISLGIAALIEIYFHRLGIMKAGSNIKHEWFKQSGIKERLGAQIIKSIDSVKNIDNILDMAKNIEDQRNALAYGSAEEEEVLSEEINTFFGIKKIIEKEVGEIV